MFYFEEVPESEPINGFLYGWRANRLNLQTFELTSPVRTQVKWGTKVMEADCMHQDMTGTPWAYFMMGMMYHGGKEFERDHVEVPQDWCSCGYYSFDSLNSYIREMDYKDTEEAIYIMTLVRLWGTIVQHDTGYRAQYVKADTVFLPEQHEPFQNIILQNVDVVVEPIEHAIDYDRSLPKPEDYLKQGAITSGEHWEAEEED